jgi:uncharacterized protein (UPF0248 family)
MVKCIASTSYTMKADIYQPTVTQDATGAVVKNWTFEKTVSCYVKGILSTGLGKNSTEVSIDYLINMLNSLVKFRSSEVIPTNRRVVRIRNNSGVVFLENQDLSSDGGFQSSTIFEPRGSTALFNFDGSVIEYETVLKRQEIQRLGA